MDHKNHEEEGWADRPYVKRRIRMVLYSACVLLVLAELLVHRHVVHPLEETPAFYALYGFAALIFAVALAKVLRWLVGRGEDYYHRDAGVDRDA